MHIIAEVNTAAESEGDAAQKPAVWMLVDDNLGVLQVISTIVNITSGVETRCFESGIAALAAMRDTPDAFQLVITDLEMPGMNGLELCQKIHAIDPGQKILLTTGNHGAIDEATARVVGFSGILYKPFSPVALQQVIETLHLPPVTAPDRVPTSH
jgi:CheY-like chemotaxis protein